MNKCNICNQPLKNVLLRKIFNKTEQKKYNHSHEWFECSKCGLYSQLVYKGATLTLNSTILKTCDVIKFYGNPKDIFIRDKDKTIQDIHKNILQKLATKE